MERAIALRKLEEDISLLCDRSTVLKGKAEDILFRAQRRANADKKNMGLNSDSMFGYDLQHVRRDVRAYAQELNVLPIQLGAVSRGAEFDPAVAKVAQSVMRLSMRLAQSLRALHETALLVHQHIGQSDHKIQAWYLAQEAEELMTRGQALPSTANKVVIATSEPSSPQG